MVAHSIFLRVIYMLNPMAVFRCIEQESALYAKLHSPGEIKAPIVPNRATRRARRPRQHRFTVCLNLLHPATFCVSRCVRTMSDGELDDLYQEVWAGFTRPPTSPNGTTLTSEDVPMTATLDSPMLPDEYSTCILAVV